jgi:hypothetical protein
MKRPCRRRGRAAPAGWSHFSAAGKFAQDCAAIAPMVFLSQAAGAVLAITGAVASSDGSGRAVAQRPSKARLAHPWPRFSFFPFRLHLIHISLGATVPVTTPRGKRNSCMYRDETEIGGLASVSTAPFRKPRRPRRWLYHAGASAWACCFVRLGPVRPLTRGTVAHSGMIDNRGHAVIRFTLRSDIPA